MSAEPKSQIPPSDAKPSAGQVFVGLSRSRERVNYLAQRGNAISSPSISTKTNKESPPTSPEKNEVQPIKGNNPTPARSGSFSSWLHGSKDEATKNSNSRRDNERQEEKETDKRDMQDPSKNKLQTSNSNIISDNKENETRKDGEIEEHDGVICGFLVKRGAARKSWKRRWWVLNDEHFSYFKTKDDRNPLGAIHLSLIFAVAVEAEAPRMHCFGVYTRHRTYYISAATFETMQRWVELLKQRISQRLPRQSVFINLLFCIGFFLL
jgi:hypothetical protein